MAKWFSQNGNTKPVPGTTVNWNNPFTDNLQFYFTLGEGSGSQVYDSCNKTDPATLVDPPTWSSGTYGTSLNFDGTTDYCENTTLRLPTSAVTLLIVSRSPTSGDTGSAFGNRDSHVGFDTSRCQVHLPFSGTIYWDFGGATGSNRTSYTPDSGFWGRWNVMVFVAGNVGSQIWENGILKASSSTAITRTNVLDGFYLGRFGNDGSRQEINIASVALWNRCLSPEEIVQLSVYPWAPFSSNTTVRTGLSSYVAANVYTTSQLGYSQVGGLQLGMIDSGAGPTPPVVGPPEMSTWFLNTEQPIIPFLEVISY